MSGHTEGPWRVVDDGVYSRRARVNACAGIPTGHIEQQRDKLLAAAKITVAENGHLADGDDCTLRHLVKAIAEVEARK